MDASIRAYTAADYATVAEICVAALDIEAPGDAAGYLAVLGRRSGTWHVAVVGGAVVGVVIGSTSIGSAGPIGHVELLAVAPAFQGGGIGRALLRSLEAAHRAAGCVELRVQGNPPSYAWPGIDTRYTVAICMVEREGYERFNDARNMSAPLSPVVVDTAADESRLAAAGIVVRRLEASDEPSIRPWLDTWGGSWRAEVLQTLEPSPAGCHVALTSSGEWLGFAAWGVNRPAIFGPMGTAEASRGMGIGGVLLKRCLADQLAAGFAVAEIGWVGPHRFYARAVGARFSRIFWLYRKAL
jgi:GNAT superfamily N-acetyltransferase